jgi:hypothetical protein
MTSEKHWYTHTRLPALSRIVTSAQASLNLPMPETGNLMELMLLWAVLFKSLSLYSHENIKSVSINTELCRRPRKSGRCGNGKNLLTRKCIIRNKNITRKVILRFCNTTFLTSFGMRFTLYYTLIFIDILLIWYLGFYLALPDFYYLHFLR